jgi:uncharacterized membrane protein YcaP (DUF421 family)
MDVIVRATVIYFAIWVIVRGAGKRELAEMTAFELVLLVTIGDLVQQAVTQQDTSITGGVLAIGTIAFWIVTTSYVSFRFPRTRRVIEGVPVVVLRDGQPLDRVLHLERMTLDELEGGARSQGIGDLRKVKLAVLEPDGRLSFITDGDSGDSGADEDGGQHSPPEKHVS